MKLRDTISLAFRTVRANKLRTGITVAIIAFGIMALVGIKTAIEAMQQKFTESFSSMGATGFTIRYRQNFNFGGRNREVEKEKKGQRRERISNQRKPITRLEAETFKNTFNFPAEVGITLSGTNGATVSLGSRKSNPNVRVFGGDENYVDQNGFTIDYGRNLNKLDVQTGRNVCLIGSDVAKKFFGDNPERPVDQVIKVNNIPYRVVGVLASKGSTLGFSWDNTIITTYNNVRQYFNTNSNASYSILVKVPDISLIDGAIGEATGTFRPIRKLATTEEDNFVVDKSDSFVEMLLKQLDMLTISAVVIGFITLLGAAIGLMNIMLVAVTERTKEVGLSKAIGGKQRYIRQQFLLESIIISVFGALLGVILGIVVGNGFAIVLNTGFVLPWKWAIIGIIICSFVGLLAGLYPAMKAARLNPIEALRYE